MITAKWLSTPRPELVRKLTVTELQPRTLRLIFFLTEQASCNIVRHARTIDVSIGDAMIEVAIRGGNFQVIEKRLPLRYQLFVIYQSDAEAQEVEITNE